MDTQRGKEEGVGTGSEASPGAARIRLIVRRNTPEYAEYLAARFAPGVGYSFEFQGHRWAYDYSSFDDIGEFCVLGRPAPSQPAPAPSPEPAEAAPAGAELDSIIKHRVHDLVKDIEFHESLNDGLALDDLIEQHLRSFAAALTKAQGSR